ncbi:cytochrome c3 family protein [Winogradskyella sp. 3972H.M.0a.05]|uniref:cytochrome c3 family protein n=1 Tax=Winogradskyella sp. 3972H.M.0a.05 TaxID=2950277 RepID=UPI00339AF559
MKQVIHRNLASKFFALGFIFLITISTSLNAQEGDHKNGKTLFNTHCAACHKLDKDMTGPALRNVEARLSDTKGLDRQWLYDWIKNNTALINSGDAYANEIKDFDASAMTAFPQLSNEEIDDILAYTAVDPCELDPQSSPDCPGYIPPPPGEGGTVGGTSNTLILGALALLFALLAMALILVKRTLNRFAEAKGVVVADEKGANLWQAFVKNQFLLLVTAIFFLLASGYFVYGYLMQIGVDQGYEPVQPIHYSHRIHAGDNGIDCKYCHSSARVSKTSGIPSLNVCMNCHKTISEVAPETLAEGQEYGVDYNAEIQKLYDAVGWDGREFTGETQPVKWIRIHNLPDFAYFNHSQHVSVGGIECQTCHGPVEEMEVMYQYSSLTMGWCINCHRETNVKVKDNEYYAKIHEELSKKYGVEQLTVAQMGGLECGKCHY